MAFYYIHPSGTAAASTDNGRYATQQTGAMSALGGGSYSGCYASLANALAATTAPAAGDFICIAGGQNYTLSGTTVFSSGIDTAGQLTLMAVDASNVENETTSRAVFVNSGATNTFWDFNWTLRNIEHNYTTSANTHINFRDGFVHAYNCRFSTAASSYFNPQDDTVIRMYDCEVDVNNGTSNPVSQVLEEHWTWIGGTYDSGGTLPSQCLQSVSGVVEWYGIDLSSFTNASSYIAAILPLANTKPCNITLTGCKLSTQLESNISNNANTFRPGNTLTLAGCASTSAAAEYSWYYEVSGLGDVQTSTAVYPTNGTQFPTLGQAVSLKVNTFASTAISTGSPLYFELPLSYIDLSASASDVLTIEIVTDNVTLYNNEVRAYLVYPDGTNKHTWNYLASTQSDMHETGTELTTSTHAWSGTGGFGTVKKYKIDLDTSSDPGAVGVPIIFLEVAKPSATIYVSTTVGKS